LEPGMKTVVSTDGMMGQSNPAMPEEDVMEDGMTEDYVPEEDVMEDGMTEEEISGSEVAEP
ncbi:MAG: hypothetical protein PUJ62_05535, partial [Lachnospiraceae bacterium]|nr:hypothetical protein [Lachnospiraceae bacterium]